MRPRRASPNARASAPRRDRPNTGPRGHARPDAGRRPLQIAGDDFVERCSFRAGDLDDAVSRRRARHIGDGGGDVVRRDGLEQAGRKPDRVSIRTRIGDAPDEIQELGRADDGEGILEASIRSLGRPSRGNIQNAVSVRLCLFGISASQLATSEKKR